MPGNSMMQPGRVPEWAVVRANVNLRYRSEMGKTSETVDSSHEVLVEQGSRLLTHIYLKATMTYVCWAWVETSRPHCNRHSRRTRCPKKKTGHVSVFVMWLHK